MNIIKKPSESNRSLAPQSPNSIWSLRDAMNRLFDESFWSPFSLMEGVQTPLWTTWPKVDIAESDSAFIVTANIPGIDPKKVEIEVTDDTISIAGSMERSEEKKEENWHRLEREYGHFHREFSLPETIDADTVKAQTKDGVLTIELKKKPGSGKKKISITEA